MTHTPAHTPTHRQTQHHNSVRVHSYADYDLAVLATVRAAVLQTAWGEKGRLP